MSNSSQHSSGKGSVKPPFLAFVNDLQDIEALKSFAASHAWMDSCILQGDIRTATEFLRQHTSPETLLVELPNANDASAMLNALADVCDPDTKVITTGSVNEYSFYCWLMEIGIFSYLLKPLTKQMLESAYQKIAEPPAEMKPKGTKSPAKFISVMGTRGGVGTTTVALNLAGILATTTAKSIALVDIDPQEGSVSLVLDMEPSRGLREALERPDRVDTLFIERVMNKPLKNLSVLSSEESLQDMLNIHDQASSVLIKELKEKFDIVVMDIPRFLNPFSRDCLRQSEHVVLVTELTLLSLRDTLRMGDLMRDGFKMKPPCIVANRMGMAAKMEMLPADFEKGVNAKIEQRIPFAPELFMQIGSDIPAIKMKSHASMKPLYQLAAQLEPEAAVKQDQKAAKGFSLFKKDKKEAD